MTFSQDGKLLKTEHAAEKGNDGLVIMPDGTKYVSSVRYGSVSEIRPGQPPPESHRRRRSRAPPQWDMTQKQKQLIIPMNDNNALAFIRLQ